MPKLNLVGKRVISSKDELLEFKRTATAAVLSFAASRACDLEKANSVLQARYAEMEQALADGFAVETEVDVFPEVELNQPGSSPVTASPYRRALAAQVLAAGDDIGVDHAASLAVTLLGDASLPESTVRRIAAAVDALARSSAPKRKKKSPAAGGMPYTPSNIGSVDPGVALAAFRSFVDSSRDVLSVIQSYNSLVDSVPGTKTLSADDVAQAMYNYSYWTRPDFPIDGKLGEAVKSAFDAEHPAAKCVFMAPGAGLGFIPLAIAENDALRDEFLKFVSEAKSAKETAEAENRQQMQEKLREIDDVLGKKTEEGVVRVPTGGGPVLTELRKERDELANALAAPPATYIAPIWYVTEFAKQKGISDEDIKQQLVAAAAEHRAASLTASRASEIAQARAGKRQPPDAYSEEFLTKVKSAIADEFGKKQDPATITPHEVNLFLTSAKPGTPGYFPELSYSDDETDDIKLRLSGGKVVSVALPSKSQVAPIYGPIWEMVLALESQEAGGSDRPRLRKLALAAYKAVPAEARASGSDFWASVMDSPAALKVVAEFVGADISALSLLPVTFGGEQVQVPAPSKANTPRAYSTLWAEILRLEQSELREQRMKDRRSKQDNAGLLTKDTAPKLFELIDTLITANPRLVSEPASRFWSTALTDAASRTAAMGFFGIAAGELSHVQAITLPGTSDTVPAPSAVAMPAVYKPLWDVLIALEAEAQGRDLTPGSAPGLFEVIQTAHHYVPGYKGEAFWLAAVMDKAALSAMCEAAGVDLAKITSAMQYVADMYIPQLGTEELNYIRSLSATTLSDRLSSGDQEAIGEILEYFAFNVYHRLLESKEEETPDIAGNFWAVILGRLESSPLLTKIYDNVLGVSYLSDVEELAIAELAKAAGEIGVRITHDLEKAKQLYGTTAVSRVVDLARKYTKRDGGSSEEGYAIRLESIQEAARAIAEEVHSGEAAAPAPVAEAEETESPADLAAWADANGADVSSLMEAIATAVSADDAVDIVHALLSDQGILPSATTEKGAKSLAALNDSIRAAYWERPDEEPAMEPLDEQNPEEGDDSLPGRPSSWLLVATDRIPGGYAAGKPDTDYDPMQLAMGKKVEMEHVDKAKIPAPVKAEIATEIAKDHLEEAKDWADPKYYTGLATMEKTMKKGSVSTISCATCAHWELGDDTTLPGCSISDKVISSVGLKNFQEYIDHPAAHQPDLAIGQCPYFLSSRESAKDGWLLQI